MSTRGSMLISLSLRNRAGYGTDVYVYTCPSFSSGREHAAEDVARPAVIRDLRGVRQRIDRKPLRIGDVPFGLNLHRLLQPGDVVEGEMPRLTVERLDLGEPNLCGLDPGLLAKDPARGVVGMLE